MYRIYVFILNPSYLLMQLLVGASHVAIHVKLSHDEIHVKLSLIEIHLILSCIGVVKSKV